MIIKKDLFVDIGAYIGDVGLKRLLYGGKMFLIYLEVRLPNTSLKKASKFDDIGPIIKSGESQWMQ